MAHTIQDFKTALKGGGARPNLFEVDSKRFRQVFVGQVGTFVKPDIYPRGKDRYPKIFLGRPSLNKLEAVSSEQTPAMDFIKDLNIDKVRNLAEDA